MRTWPDDLGLRAEMKLLEQEGDRITHDVIHELYSTAVTPLDREDIHALAAAIDDVVDYAEETADVHWASTRSRLPMDRPWSLTRRPARTPHAQVAAALGKLGCTVNEDKLPPHLIEVDRLEDEGDRISRQALVSLFAGGIDPMVVIRWKDLFERLEEAIDACERVSHVLEGIVVKQA